MQSSRPPTRQTRPPGNPAGGTSAPGAGLANAPISTTPLPSGYQPKLTFQASLIS